MRQLSQVKELKANRKMKAAEALYYKKLIESAQGPKEMWRALNSALGNEKVENLTFQLQEGERIISMRT